jgi:hypothetical protein
MATKRVQVERLRPQTQEGVIVRPVSTYVTPAPVQDGRLKQLSNFVERLEPRMSRLVSAQMELDKEEDKKRARELAETTTANYDELVKQGKLDPSESPVFQYAFNETRGQNQGYEFIAEASQAYSRSNLVDATDATNFDEWYNQYYQDYVENNQGLLAKNGAYEKFSAVAGQARNNLLSSHLASTRKNFEVANDAAYKNFVFGALANTDFRQDGAAAVFANTFNEKQKDLAASGGDGYSFSKLNIKTVDAMVEYYETTLDADGFEEALNAVSGGTGPLAGTGYAVTELAKARTEWATALLKREKEVEANYQLNVTLTERNVKQLYFEQFAEGNFNYPQIEANIEKKYGEEFMAQVEEFYPDFLVKMQEAGENWQTHNNSEPMSIKAQAEFRVDLEGIPPSQRVAKVLKWAAQGALTEQSVYSNLLSFAQQSAKAAKSGLNLDATKDPIYKDFFEREFALNTDKYTGAGRARLYYFQSSFYELFDQTDEDGKRVWETYSSAKKLQLLNGVMNEVASALKNKTALTQTTSNKVEPVLNPDGTPKMFNGEILYKVNNLN